MLGCLSMTTLGKASLVTYHEILGNAIDAKSMITSWEKEHVHYSALNNL